MDVSELQAALPREMYVDEASWLIERDRVLRAGVDVRRTARRPRASEAQRACVIEVFGESLILTSDADGVLHAAYNVCRHRGSQIFPPSRARRRCRVRLPR